MFQRFFTLLLIVSLNTPLNALVSNIEEGDELDLNMTAAVLGIITNFILMDNYKAAINVDTDINIITVDTQTAAIDSDNDGTPDIFDEDDDNDGELDNDDPKPLDANITSANPPIKTGTINALDRTFIAKKNPDSVQDASTVITLKNIASSQSRIGLLYFAIPITINGEVLGEIIGASLKLTSSTEQDNLNIYLAKNGISTYDSATWNNSIGYIADGSTPLLPYGSGSYDSAINGYDINITGTLSTGQVVFAIDEQGNTKNDLDSSSLNKMQLTVRYQEASKLTIAQVGSSYASQAAHQLEYQVSLKSAPTHNVYLTIKVENSSAIIDGNKTLLFTPNNWNTPQRILITGNNSSQYSGNTQNKLILYPLNSLDVNFNGFNPDDLNFTVYSISFDNLPNNFASINSGVAFRYDINASTSDDVNITYTLQNPPMGMSINKKIGMITWQPDISQVGEHNITVVATSATNNTLSTKILLNVVAVNANPTGQNILYLSPSKTNPSQEILDALATASPGTTIYIRGGVYKNINLKINNIHGSENNQITLAKLDGERVKLIFNDFSAFGIDENTSYLVFDGLEVDGEAFNDHWEVLKNSWWDFSGAGVKGGGQAFNIDGKHITVKNCIIHDTTQKGINIYKGRYINILGNLVYNIGYDSLSGGHGIMRKWTRNFHINPTDGVDLGEDIYSPSYPYRFDISGNLLLRIEQRIYSRVFSKGYANFTIDEGKAILLDNTEDTDPKSRVSNNLILYNGVTHIRLKGNPNQEIYGNSIHADLTRTDTSPDGITDKEFMPNLQFYGNLVASKGIAIDVQDSFPDDDQAALNDTVKKHDNFYAGGGRSSGSVKAGITDMGSDVSLLFNDVEKFDFTHATGILGGISEQNQMHLKSLARDYGVEIKSSGWEHNHLKNAEYIINNIPSSIFDTSTYYIGNSSVEEGHQALFIKIIDSDGEWLYDKFEDGESWGTLENSNLSTQFKNVKIQKCSTCTGAYVFQIIAPHVWFEHYGNDTNTTFTINGNTKIIYLDPINNTEHKNILDYSAKGKVKSY